MFAFIGIIAVLAIACGVYYYRKHKGAVDAALRDLRK